MPTQEGIELSWFGAVIRRWLWLITACMLLAGAIVYAVTRLAPPVYEATTTLLVVPAQDSKSNENKSLAAGERLAITYSQMADGEQVLGSVISRLGLSTTPGKLAAKIRVIPVKSTQLIRLTVKDRTPEDAALLANTTAEVFATSVQALQSERYTGSLKSMQDKMDTLSAQIEDTQAKINSLSSQRTSDQSEQSRLQGLQEQYRNDYHTLQSSYQTLQIDMTQAVDKLHIINSAQIERAQSPALASATVLIDQELITGGPDTQNSPASSERIAETYGPMVTSSSVLTAVIKQLSLAISPETLAENITVIPVYGTQLIKIQVRSGDGAQAVLLTDTLVKTFISHIQALLAQPYSGRLASLQFQMDELSAKIDQTQAALKDASGNIDAAETELTRLKNLMTGYQSDYRIQQQDSQQLKLASTQAADAVVISERASVPARPAQNNSLYILVAAGMGAVLGLVIALVVELVEHRIRSSRDVTTELGIATLGLIGKMERNGNSQELITNARENASVAEDFRMLAIKVRLLAQSKSMHTLLVTSPYATEGKSFVTANLAAALAKSGLRVVVVDGDMRLPRLHKIFKVSQNRGLSEILTTGSMDSNLQPTHISGLTVLASGKPPENPAELVSSPDLKKLFNLLIEEADMVIIDSPPILSVADTTMMASITDGVLLVIKSGYTFSQAGKDAVEAIHKVTPNLIGAILNAVPAHTGGYYRYYHDPLSGSKDGAKEKEELKG